MTPAERLLARLDAVKQTGTGRWMCRCPAHADRHPSLSVREVDDGRLLLRCWAGCETEAVLRAAGLEFRDLFPEPITTHAPRISRPHAPGDILKALAFEATVVALQAADLEKGRPINRERLLVAVSRLADGAEAARRG